MKITKTKFEGVLLIEPTVYTDNRGHFFESYRADLLADTLGENISFVQENQSISGKDVFRGFHFQLGDAAQCKLVKVVSGAIIDFVVNIQTGEYLSFELNETNKHQLYIDRRYAHGFLSLKDFTIVQYKCDKYYDKTKEAGFTYNDHYFAAIDFNNVIVSEKDLILPRLSTILMS